MAVEVAAVVVTAVCMVALMLVLDAILVHLEM